MPEDIPIIANIFLSLFLLVICIVAIGILWRKIFPNPKNPKFRWQAQTDYDVVINNYASRDGTFSKTYLRPKDPQKQAKYFVPKGKK